MSSVVQVQKGWGRVQVCGTYPSNLQPFLPEGCKWQSSDCKILQPIVSANQLPMHRLQSYDHCTAGIIRTPKDWS